MNALRTLLYIYRESLKMAYGVLVQNKLRSFLSVLGITIGIFCIILVLTMVSSLKRDIQSSLNTFGTDVVFVDRWAWQNMGSDYPWWKFLSRPMVKYENMEFIRDNGSKTIISAVAMQFRPGNYLVENGDYQAEDVNTMAITHDYNRVQSLDIEYGRYFTEQESGSGKPVAIIGATLADKLFPGESAEGRTIRVNKLPMQVVGILRKQGISLTGNPLDDAVIVPYWWARQRTREDYQQGNANIQVKAADGIPVDELMYEVEGLMRSSRRIKPGEEPDFAVNKMSMFMDVIDGIFGTLNQVGWIIGLFSLVVGCFGVANIMFVSVKERTSQIGIQKALGARRSFIRIQFLVESIILCLLGGITGMFLVYLATLLGNYMLEHIAESGLRLGLTLNNIIYGMGISVIVGVVAGIIPAIQASRLNPVDAIRSK